MKYSLFFIVLVLFGCQPQSTEEATPVQPAAEIPIREHSEMAVLWQQNASEYKALCYQSYNLAKLYLDKMVEANNDSKKPLAIVTDIDETVVDNSYYNAWMIEEDVDYTKETWIEWGKRESATAVPGALEFFNYAKEKGVEVFYISNRFTVQQEETMANVKALGFPYVDDAHFLLKETTSKKQERRDKVLESHNVVMYLGDNLSDFASPFDGTDRKQFVDSIKSKLGFEFILLPNPMYGDWETKGLYEGKYDWTHAQRDSIREAKLKRY
jgi:5'-nucleotidase (lipoprotein e(P4) family)